jgi:hypothetical protein
MLDYCWIANFVITMSSLYMLHDWYTGEPPLSPQAETSVASCRRQLLIFQGLRQVLSFSDAVWF